MYSREIARCRVGEERGSADRIGGTPVDTQVHVLNTSDGDERGPACRVSRCTKEPTCVAWPVHMTIYRNSVSIVYGGRGLRYWVSLCHQMAHTSGNTRAIAILEHLVRDGGCANPSGVVVEDDLRRKGGRAMNASCVARVSGDLCQIWSVEDIGNAEQSESEISRRITP